MTRLQLRRAYEAANPDDGYRVYIDRLWPRGLSHETFRYDAWDKAIAPSDELRHRFHSNPDALWANFKKDYRAELKANPGWASFAAELSAHPVVTLLYSSRNETENNAVVVADTLAATYPDKFTIS